MGTGTADRHQDVKNRWRTCAATLVVVACLPVLSGCVTTRYTASFKAEKIDPILRDLQSKKVIRVTVFSVPRWMTTFVNVTPEVLVQMCHHPVQKDLDGALRIDLLEALAETKGREVMSQPDLRWGIHFLDARGECLHKVYLDGAGRKAVVDGAMAKVNRRLIHWLERNFGRQ